MNLYEQIKRKLDFNFKLVHNIRVRTRQAFKSQNVEKLNKTLDVIGCCQTFLRKWIFYQLHGNMTEENYGSLWTIDHCYPLSKTNLSNETDMFKSSHWINLRPLFYIKNSSKGFKIDNYITRNKSIFFHEIKCPRRMILNFLLLKPMVKLH